MTPFRPRDAYHHWTPITTRWHDNDACGHIDNMVYRLGVFANGEAEAAAEGCFTHVCVGRHSRRPVPLPDAWRPILERLV